MPGNILKYCFLTDAEFSHLQTILAAAAPTSLQALLVADSIDPPVDIPSFHLLVQALVGFNCADTNDEVFLFGLNEAPPRLLIEDRGALQPTLLALDIGTTVDRLDSLFLQVLGLQSELEHEQASLFDEQVQQARALIASVTVKHAQLPAHTLQSTRSEVGAWVDAVVSILELAPDARNYEWLAACAQQPACRALLGKKQALHFVDMCKTLGNYRGTEELNCVVLAEVVQCATTLIRIREICVSMYW
jgi:hypothetical protein